MDRVWRTYYCCLLSAGCLFALALGSVTSAQTANPPTPEPVGYAHSSEMIRLLHWPHFPVRLFFSPTPYAGTERRAQARAGFDEWVRATRSVVCYQIVHDPTQADITVTLTASVNMPQEARALGQTILTYTDTTLSKAVIQLVEREDEPARFQEICAHEFGHALGLDGHSDDPDDMMFPVLSHSLFQVQNMELDGLCIPGTVTTRDVQTLKAAYPPEVFAPKTH